MSRISGLTAREVLDSRGNPTVEVEVHLKDGSSGSAIVPSGASVGSLEAVELRDNDTKRFHGKGVTQAIHNVRKQIDQRLKKMPADDQAEIDAALIDLDGTPNKSRLGANAILGVSLAVAHAAAQARKIPLFQHLNDLHGSTPMRMPVPMMNILNGGAHANNNVEIQEFMVIPTGAKSFGESLRCGAEIFHVLKAILSELGLSTAVGDEGGFAPNLDSNEAVLDMLQDAVKRAGYTLGESVFFGLDCAATEFHRDGYYQLDEGSERYTGLAWCENLQNLVNAYPEIVSIEDGLAEMDYEHWKHLTNTLGNRTQLVGDDLFVTNLDVLRKGKEERWANAILVKPNQIGTLSETLAVIQFAHQNGFATVVSHRSGDTEDTTIADLAVGTGAGQIKTGSLSRSERIAKYNRLLRIEEMLPDAEFRGKLEFNRFHGRSDSCVR